MALITCKECGKPFRDAAKSCPDCGVRPAKPTRTWTALDALAVVIIAGAMAVGLLVAFSDDRSAKLESGARGAAEIFVASSLRSPSTASFAPRDEWTVEPNGAGGYRISAWVDSQNTFGAMLRKRFDAEMKRENDNWELVDLTMSQWTNDPPRYAR